MIMISKEKVQESKIIHKAATSFLMVLALGGCSTSAQPNPNVPGIIIEKEYDDPDEWVTYSMVGKTVVPIHNQDPEHFILHIEQCDPQNEETPSNEKCNVFNVEVEEKQYNELLEDNSVIFVEDGVEKVLR